MLRTHLLPQGGKETSLLRAKLQDTPPRVAGFGHRAIDAAFAGEGLSAGTHQAAGEGTAALAFGLALVARTLAERPTTRALLIEAAEATRETGLAYAPGLQALGLDPDRLAIVRARTEGEALRVMDEALRSGAVAAVLADLGRAPRLDLSVTRRFNLSARRAGTLGLLVTHDLDGTSAALSRWRAAPHLSRGTRRRLGRPAFQLRLLRNRLGPTGEWTLEWDSDDRVFRPPAPLSAPVARPPVDRPGPAGEPDPGLAPGAYRQAV
ncbi:MAG TPA: hypothetical protein VL358_09865 [Caulobacteraceae bacterium]|nr:hypothetical protein [Caulobacteraceae bacterium]